MVKRHGHGLVHEEKSPMQKHNEYVDKVKDTWAAEHGIPLIRIWEHDINDNPGKVTKMLRTRIGEATEKQEVANEKKKRHGQKEKNQKKKLNIETSLTPPQEL